VRAAQVTLDSLKETLRVADRSYMSEPSVAARSRVPSTAARMYLTFLLLLGLGIVPFGALIIASAFEWRAQTQPIEGGVSTIGQVVAVKGENEGTKLGYLYVATVAFNDLSGQIVRFDGPKGSVRPILGSPGRVSYPPSHPAAAHDLSQTGTRWGTALFIGAALILVGVWLSFILIRNFLRTRPHPDEPTTAKRLAA
jgi:hypothetical protein